MHSGWQTNLASPPTSDRSGVLTLNLQVSACKSPATRKNSCEITRCTKRKLLSSNALACAVHRT